MLNDKIIDKIIGKKKQELDKEFNKIKRSKDFVQSYHNSPMFKERRKNIFGTIFGQGHEEIVDNVNKSFENVELYWGDNLGSRYRRDRSDGSQKVIIDPVQTKEINSSNDIIAAHEFSHLAYDFNHTFDLRMNEPFRRRKLVKSIVNDENKHDRDFEERKADIDALRYMLFKGNIYDARYEVFEQKHLDLAKKKFGNDFIMKRMLRLFSEDDIVKFMNIIASRENNKNNNKV